MWPGKIRRLFKRGVEQLDGLRRISAEQGCAVKIRDVAIIGPLVVQNLILGDYFEAVRHGANVGALNEDISRIAPHQCANCRAARLSEIVLGLVRSLVARNLVKRRLYVRRWTANLRAHQGSESSKTCEE